MNQIELTANINTIIDELKSVTIHTCTDFRYSKYYQEYIIKVCDDISKLITDFEA